jgi:hypothetical protein
MIQITFVGVVLPKERNTTFHSLDKMTLDTPKGLNVVCVPHIQNGNAAIVCTSNRELQADELTRLYTRVYEMVRTALDVLAFATGQGFTLILNRYINSAGREIELVIENPALAQLCTSFNLENPDFTNTLRLFQSDPHLSWALKDLIEANTLPNHASINCARAIESLRVLMTDPTIERKKAWIQFQTALRLTREFREYVTLVSTGPRHGDRTPIGGDLTLEVTRRAWQIMDRFIEYRKRGNQPLPEDDFPLL